MPTNQTAVQRRASNPFVAPLAAADLIRVVQDTATTPVTREMTAAELRAELSDNDWTLVPAANYTAAPASTSTLTAGVDMTASIKAGMSARYVIGGVTYYGQFTAVAAALFTFRGAPLSGNVTNLYYGGGTIIQAAWDGSVNVDGTAITTALKTGTVYTAHWMKQTAYVIGYDVYQTTHDSGTHGKFTLKVNGTDINTSAGGLAVAANATWYSTVVDIAVAAYDINPGEDLIAVVTQGTTVDGAGLRFNALILVP